MTAMVRMPGVPDSGDAYTMNAIAIDVPMATLAVTAGVVAILNFKLMERTRSAGLLPLMLRRHYYSSAKVITLYT